MTFSYCPTCGEKLHMKEIGDEGLVPFCESCNKPLFNFSYPCIIVLVTDENDNIVLIKQSYVSESNYVCIAGYVKQGETVEDAVKREVLEEVGLEVKNLQYVQSYYHPKGDNLMIGFTCKAKSNEFRVSGEVDNAEWFTREEAKAVLTEGSIAMQLYLDCISSKLRQESLNEYDDKRNSQGIF